MRNAPHRAYLGPFLCALIGGVPSQVLGGSDSSLSGRTGDGNWLKGATYVAPSNRLECGIPLCCDKGVGGSGLWAGWRVTRCPDCPSVPDLHRLTPTTGCWRRFHSSRAVQGEVKRSKTSTLRGCGWRRWRPRLAQPVGGKSQCRGCTGNSDLGETWTFWANVARKTGEVQGV